MPLHPIPSDSGRTRAMQRLLEDADCQLLAFNDDVLTLFVRGSDRADWCIPLYRHWVRSVMSIYFELHLDRVDCQRKMDFV